MIDVTKCRHCGFPFHHTNHDMGAKTDGVARHMFEAPQPKSHMTASDIAMIEILTCVFILLGILIVMTNMAN